MSSKDIETNDRVYITAEGLETLKIELDELRTTKRTEVAVLIQKAKELGDITDSAQYDAAKDEQAFLEGRIRQLEDQVTHATIIEETSTKGGIIRIGSKVTLVDSDGIEEKWEIVGRAESDASKGRISNESPVAKAIIGRAKGEKAQVNTPGGIIELTIKSLE
jgi:transcription elongation factor GreA